MAKITLTKKGIILLFFILVAIAGVIAYVVIKQNQANEDSLAADCWCMDTSNTCGSDDTIGNGGCNDDAPGTPRYHKACCAKAPTTTYCSQCGALDDCSSLEGGLKCKVNSDPNCNKGWTWQPDASCAGGCVGDGECLNGKKCVNRQCVDDTQPPTGGTCTTCGACAGGSCQLTSNNRCVCVPTTPVGSCNGAIGSGQQCTGNPGDGYSWSCWNVGGSWKCVKEPVTSCKYQAVAGGPLLDCGCDTNACVNKCKEVFAGQPGHHEYGDFKCSACQQLMGCSCDIPSGPEDKVCFQTGCSTVGCSDGSTCVDNKCINPACPTDSDCNCVEAQTLNIKGRVYCQDGATGTKYPVVNAQVQFYKDGALGGTRSTETLTTDNNGYYVSANTTQKKDGDFAVRFVNSSLTGTLSTGQPYSSMVFDTKNAATCSTYCNGCAAGTNYELCAKFPNSGLVQSFDYVFKNCTPPPKKTCFQTGCKAVGGCSDGSTCDQTLDKCINTQCPTDSDCLCTVVNPSWAITKVASPVCINPNTENVSALVTYDVAVRNTSTVAGTLNRVVDSPANVQFAWLVPNSINPAFGVAAQTGDGGLTITWTLTGANATFAAGETKHYTYQISVPRANFGTYVNTATGYPNSDTTGSFNISNSTYVACNLPNNALFDEPASRIALGVFLLIGGVVYLYVDGGNNTLGKAYKYASRFIYQDVQNEVKLEHSRSKFESRVIKKKAKKKA